MQQIVVFVFTMQAVLQMSAGGPYSAPMRTSRARYCRVWMSSVKCLCLKTEIKISHCRHWLLLQIVSVICFSLTTQQAFPRSAIFTLSLSAFCGSRGLRTKSVALKAKRKERTYKVTKWTGMDVNSFMCTSVSCYFLTITFTWISRLQRNCRLRRCWHHRAGKTRHTRGRAREPTRGMVIKTVLQPGARWLWTGFAVICGAGSVSVDNYGA